MVQSSQLPIFPMNNTRAEILFGKEQLAPHQRVLIPRK
jgi:hypothetical protein